MSLLLVLLLLLSLSLLLLLHPLFALLLNQLCSPLRHLPGPASPSLLFGNLSALDDQENNNLVLDWVAKYGPTFVYRGFLSGRRLLTVDPDAIRYVLGHAYDFPKPPFIREALADMAAGHESLLTVEGEDHRRQRKILAPAFSSLQIKAISPIFWEKSLQLRDIWLSIHAEHQQHQKQQQPQQHSPCRATSEAWQTPNEEDSSSSISQPTPTPAVLNSAVRIDVLLWLSRATLDVIGLAGFGYHFHSLASATLRPGGASASAVGSAGGSAVLDPGNPNELAQAFAVIFSTARKFRVLTIFQAWVPALRYFRRNIKTMSAAQATMRRIGLELISERKREVMAEKEATAGGATAMLTSSNTWGHTTPSHHGMFGDDEKVALRHREKGGRGSVSSLSSRSRSSSPPAVDEEGRPVVGRDLLSVLIRSNQLFSSSTTHRTQAKFLSPTDPQPQQSHQQQMSREEILCQVSMFIAAGHETVSSALSWCLYALARAPHAQTRLREALRALPAPPCRADLSPPELESLESPQPPQSPPTSPFCSTMLSEPTEELTDAVQRCTYLDWVVRESLRLHAPVTGTMRTVGRARDVIPLREPIVDRRGVLRRSVEVRRGDIVCVPIGAVNRGEEVWGKDAHVFRPERWADPPAAAKGIPGLYSNVLTFLNGNGSVASGNRSCIGWRFALAEIKILLCVLVRDLEFAVDPGLVVEKRINVVTRPFVRAEAEKGNQMPLFVRPVPPAWH